MDKSETEFLDTDEDHFRIETYDDMNERAFSTENSEIISKVNKKEDNHSIKRKFQSGALNKFDDCEEEEELKLDGEYMMRKALMKDHDIDQIKKTEMIKILKKFSRNHVGKNEDGNKLTKLYLKGKEKLADTRAMTQMTIDFMRNFRKESSLKGVLDLIDTILFKIQEMCPFGSMINLFFQLDKEADIWFIPNRKEVQPGIIKIKNLMNFRFKKSFNKFWCNSGKENERLIVFQFG